MFSASSMFSADEKNEIIFKTKKAAFSIRM
jgi:hypothetical protein